jgi:molybdate transport system ATP-binding protein
MNVFGIKHLANTSFLQLSSGEQRLVLLSRAFVKDPSLLILDEPLHGLDSLNSRLVLDIVETFSKRKGKTLIVVSHYLEEIPECVDNVLTLGISQD